MKRVEDVLVAVLGVETSAITDNTKPADIENWDSFNGLILVTELEKNFKVQFSLEEIVAVKRVADIKKILKHHGVNIRKNNSK